MTDDPKSEKSTGQKPVWAVQGYLVHPSSTRRFAPSTDIIEREDSIIVLVEIAGMAGDGFKIALHSQTLVISGTRPRPEIADAAYHQAEIGFGEFRLRVPMPWSVERDQVNASYNNGFLRIDLPRQKARRVHIVDVNTDDELS